MGKNEKIKIFQDNILTWYKISGRKFSWRKKNISKYKYVIVETLLQRTKAETVAKFFPKFVKQFPSWKTLANARINDIAFHLKHIGLQKQRSIRLKKLAIEMVKRKGKFPKKRNELEAIPFMGQYIANAVELMVFNQCSPLLDVNMTRVLERYFGPRKMSDIRYDPYLQALSTEIVTHVDSKEINWAILDLAATICKAKHPNHIICPLKEYCKYYQSQI